MTCTQISNQSAKKASRAKIFPFLYSFTVNNTYAIFFMNAIPQLYLFFSSAGPILLLLIYLLIIF